MRKDTNLSSIARMMLACGMSVILVLGLTPALVFAAPSDDTLPALVAAGSDLASDSSTGIESWSALQEKIDSAEYDSTIKLTKTLAATESDSCLVIPYGARLTIDLAGWTLNRNLAEACSDGAVIQVSRDAELTLVNTGAGEATIKGGRNSYDGGGIINQGVLVIGGKGDLGAIRIVDNEAEFGAGIFNMGTATINGATVYNNDASSSGGGFYNQGGELIVTDAMIDRCNAEISGGGIYNSGGAVTIDGATISNCDARANGGAISNAGTLAIEYAVIRANHAHEMGGGVYVGRRGKATIEDGLIDLNNAAKDGGGVYVETTGTLTLGYAPSINSNKAGESCHGGGVYVRGNLVAAGGRPTVNSNTRGNSAADNIYLPGSKKIDVAGHLSGGKLAVTLEGGIGQVTQGFGAQGNTVATFFKGDNLFSAVKDGEVWLQEQEPQPEFMRPNTLLKPSQVNGANWMAAIPGEWYITEFNVPYSHDSATKRISKWHVIGNFICQGQLKKQGADYATTQLLSIPDQLKAGVRCLDVRMNNLYAYDGGDFDCKWTDDGKNLWVCHGRSMTTGTYFALNPDATMISVSQVLDEVKQFLRDHPTETVSILFTVESHQYDKVHDLIFWRLKGYLEELANETNPSTGEPYLYREEGRGFFDHYTHFPKLEDCRGKIVVQYDAKEADIVSGKTGGRIIGGMLGLRDVNDEWPEGVKWMREKGGNGVHADDKIDNINEFIDYVRNWPQGWPQIARDATTHRNYFFFMSPSTHVEDGWSYFTNTNHPLDVAEDVNQEFFDKNGAFFNQRGKYVGWVKMDGIKDQYAEMIWKSNFASDDFLDYCNVTVKSGRNDSLYPDQPYKVLKGSSITMPECIYGHDPQGSQSSGEFVGWELQKSGPSGAEVLHPGDTYIVDSDTVITAQWGNVSYDDLEVHLELGADDVNLGPGQSTSFTTPVGEKLSMAMMNQASRPNYVLDGWYTADGVKITESTRLRQSMCDKDDNGAIVMTEHDGRVYQQLTLTAHWISTKTPAVLVSPPTAKDLMSNGNQQELVNAGNATGGTLKYALSDGDFAPSDSAFSAEIPKGKESGTYYVWYKVVGDDSHDGTEASYIAVTIKHAHVPGEARHENEVAATCTEEGSYDEVVRCTVCNEVISSIPAAVPALGHDWGEWVVQRATTEDNDGLRFRDCARCSETELEVMPARDHVCNPVFRSRIEPDCVSSGTQAHYECACGKWFSDSGGTNEISPGACRIAPSGHTPLKNIVPQSTDETPATCTDPGGHNNVYRCDKCARVLSVTHSVDAAKGHAWIVDEATNEDGWRVSATGATVYEDRECSVCGFTETRSYDKDHEHALTHVEGEPATCELPGVKGHFLCSICGHAFLSDAGSLKDATEAELAAPALGHDWGEWVVTKEATETAEGAEEHVCSRCGEVEARSIRVKGVVSYREVSGDGAVWTKGSGASLSFTFKRSEDDNETFDRFTGIQMDGVNVDGSDYAAEPGSVVVTLSPGYLETLSVGEHVLTAMFDDAASVQANFKIVARGDGGASSDDGSGGGDAALDKKDGAPGGTKPAAPRITSAQAKTGDSLQAALAITLVLLFASALALVGLTAMRRRSQ